MNALLPLFRKLDIGIFPNSRPSGSNDEKGVSLTEKGFEASPRSAHIYYHARIPKARFVIRQLVIRLERRSDRWRLESSFSIGHETGLALEAADSLLRDLKSRRNDVATL